MPKNMGTYLTIGIFLISIIFGGGKLVANLIADNINQQKDIDSMKPIVEELKTKTDKGEVMLKELSSDLDRTEAKIDKILDLSLKGKR